MAGPSEPRYILTGLAPPFFRARSAQEVVDACIDDDGALVSPCGECDGPGPAPTVELKVGDTAPTLPSVVRRQDLQAFATFEGQEGRGGWRGSPRRSRRLHIECKSLAERLENPDCTTWPTSWPAPTTFEDNTKFAKATALTLQGRNGGPSTVGTEGADFPLLADPNKEAASSTAC